MQPKVSIAIISYNHAEFIEECINSCIHQDYEPKEIIVVDDASLDGTQEIIQRLASKHPEVRIILNDRNIGITPNSQKALEHCSGDFVCLIGGDDVLVNGKIRKQVEFFQAHPEATLVYHEAEVFDSSTGRTMYHYTGRNIKEGGVAELIRHHFLCAGTAMFRRKDTPKGGFNTDVKISSDWMFWIDLIGQSGGKVLYMPGVYYKYRRHNNNITRQSDSGTADYSEIFQILGIARRKYPVAEKHIAAKETEFVLLHLIHNWRKGNLTFPGTRIGVAHLASLPWALAQVTKNYLRAKSRIGSREQVI